MTGEFKVVPSNLESAALDFDIASSDLSSVLSTLIGSLADSGGMAGNDKPGGQFAAFYDKSSHSVEDLLRTCVKGLGSIGDGLRATADNYSTSDKSAVHKITGKHIPK